MYILDGKQLRVGKAFTGTDGTQYPANWLQLSSEEERTAIGITEVADPTPFDSGFYAGRDNEDNLIPLEFADLGPDPVSGIVTTGLQTQWKIEQDNTAYNLLSPNDWYVTRKYERGVDMPVGIASFRADVVSVCAERQTMIDAAINVEQLKSLVREEGTEAIVGYTTTFLPNWPNIQDYT